MRWLLSPTITMVGVATTVILGGSMEVALGGMAAVEPVVDTGVEDIVMATEQADTEDPVIGLEEDIGQEVAEEADQEVAEEEVTVVVEVADQVVVAVEVEVEEVVTAVEDIVKLMRNPEMPPSTYPPSVSAKDGTPYKLPHSSPESSIP